MDEQDRTILKNVRKYSENGTNLNLNKGNSERLRIVNPTSPGLFGSLETPGGADSAPLPYITFDRNVLLMSNLDQSY